MTRKTIFIVVSLIILGTSISYSGVAVKDTSRLESSSTNFDMEDTFFYRNLDSLMNLYYVKQSLALTNIDSMYEADTTFLADIITPDSVFIKRLSEIPSVIELSFNDVVRSFLNAYTNKKRDKVEVMLGMTDYYFPFFEQILDEYDLPHELKYLPVIESALNPRAVSRAGATGLWQFMYSTGKMYNLEINSYVDDRRDVLQSSYAAARFLSDLYQMFGDWVLVIAAYNCGPGNVKKAIARSGGKTNYWDIYYLLPRETRGYVPAFIAATYTVNYYKEHNMSPKKIALPLATDTLTITEELHLKQVADVLGIDIDLLRELNPQYKLDIIPAKTKPYWLRLPYEYSSQFIANQDSIFNYKDEIYFDPTKLANAPGSKNYNGAPPPKNSTKIYYTVKEGDNVGFISDWYDVNASDLKYWNNINKNLIRVGQKLVIYVPENKKEKYSGINKMDLASKQNLKGKSVPQQNNVVANNSTGEYIYYTVSRGDNLWDIASKFPGVSATDIKNLNNIRDTKAIKPGQKLKIKKKD